MKFSKRQFILSFGAMLLIPSSAKAEAETQNLVTMHKDPSCSCCSSWLKHIAAAGFPTKTIEDRKLIELKKQHGIPSELWSCHTATIDGYLIEGHVPAAALKRLVAERPEIRGLAVPGMPVGSPGMESRAIPDEYEIISFGTKELQTFMRFKGSESLD